MSLPPHLSLQDTAQRTIAWDEMQANAHVDSGWTVRIDSIPAGDAFFYSILVKADSVSPKIIERMLLIKRPVGIENKDESMAVPSSFSVSQNYPNPFNPLTRFSVELAQKGAVLLQVYDVAGRKVSEIEKGIKSAGRYQYAFDGSDLVSGVYFLRFQVNGMEVAVRKMILLK